MSKRSSNFKKIERDSFLKHFKCFCGNPSVEADTWFNWYPCEVHRHLNPIQYGEKVREYEQKK